MSDLDLGTRVRPSKTFLEKHPRAVTGDGEVVGFSKDGKRLLVKWALYSQSRQLHPDELEPIV
jgi:hypothetical protein